MNNIPAQQLYTVSQAAGLLGVSTKTLRNWEKKNLIKSERTMGGHRRYKTSDIESFISRPKKRAITENYLSISEAASKLHVTTKTLRNWERDGLISSDRTSGGHRRYKESELKSFLTRPRRSVQKPAVITPVAVPPSPAREI